MLQSDCLVFRTSSGESIPCSAEYVAVEIMGEAADQLDPELIHNVAAAVLHYFKSELQRSSVTVGEFTEVLARVLRGLGMEVTTGDEDAPGRLDGKDWVVEDLRALAVESGKGFELLFFNNLRVRVQEKMAEAPDQLCFLGLRGCVKQMLGARRWSGRCQQLNDQIVEYLRGCFGRYSEDSECALVVR